MHPTHVEGSGLARMRGLTAAGEHRLLAPHLRLANTQPLVKSAATTAFVLARVCPVEGAFVAACVSLRLSGDGLISAGR